MKSKFINILAFVFGLGLLIGFVYYTGPSKFIENLYTIGWGFLWVLLIFLGEILTEVMAWQASIPSEQRPGYFVLFAASVGGGSINAFLPGGQAGEFLKGNLLIDIMSGKIIVSSLSIYNFMYTQTTLIVLFFVSLLCLITGTVSLKVSLGLFIGIGISGLILTIIFYWIRKGAVHHILRIVKKIPFLKKNVTDEVLKKGRDIDISINNFKHTRRFDYFQTMFMLIIARIIGIIEVWAILLLLNHPVSFILASGIFAAGQLFYYITLVLPTRVGVLEGGAIGIFRLFSLPGSLGIAMEVTRRLRKFVYTGLGLLLLAWLGFYKKGALYAKKNIHKD